MLNRSQQGFLIPLALFILMVMGGLAAAITRMGTMNGVTPLQEHLSMQAYYTARTGAEYAMHNVYFLPPGSSATINYAHVLDVCQKLQNHKINTLPQTQCDIELSCTPRCVPASTPSGNGSGPTAASTGNHLHLTITSRGICGQKGQIWGDRTIEIASVFDGGSDTFVCP